MCRTDRIWLVAAAISVLSLAAPAAAQTSTDSPIQNRLGLKMDGDQPIQIESDRLEVREQESKAIFSGNVSVVQGPTLLKAGSLIVYYVSGTGSATTGSAAIDRLEVEGKVYVKSDDQIATGDKGTFDMKTEVLTLTGKEVVLSQGTNVLVGCQLTVEMKSGKANVEACGGRVKGLFQPNSMPQSGSSEQSVSQSQ